MQKVESRKTSDILASSSLWRRKKNLGNFVLSVSPLKHEAETSGTNKWKATPKTHLVRHLGVEQAQSWNNLRFTWTCANEDVVGAMIQVSCSCHSFTETALFKHSFPSCFCDDILVMTRADSMCTKGRHTHIRFHITRHFIT